MYQFLHIRCCSWCFECIALAVVVILRCVCLMSDFRFPSYECLKKIFQPGTISTFRIGAGTALLLHLDPLTRHYSLQVEILIILGFKPLPHLGNYSREWRCLVASEEAPFQSRTASSLPTHIFRHLDFHIHHPQSKLTFLF